MNVVARDVVDCLEVFVPLPGALSTVEPATRVHAVNSFDVRLLAVAFAFFAFLGFLAGQAAAGAGLRLSGKKAKKGKKGKGKGNGKKPHIKTIDGVNPGGWLDGAQGSSEWDEGLQAIDDVTGDYVHDPFIDDVTGDYVAPPDDSD